MKKPTTTEALLRASNQQGTASWRGRSSVIQTGGENTARTVKETISRANNDNVTQLVICSLYRGSI